MADILGSFEAAVVYNAERGLRIIGWALVWPSGEGALCRHRGILISGTDIADV